MSFLPKFLGCARAAAWLILSALLAAPAVAADEKAAEKKPAAAAYTRVQRDKDGEPTALETAIVRFVPAAGGDLTVDLVGVVHIGDRAYYQKLNKLFEQYDVVLYELVAPQGTRPPKGGKRDADNPLAMIMQLAKAFLRLDSQVELIDYTKKNFVHADLSPEEMAEAMKKRGEDGMTLFLGVMADMLRQQNVQGQNPPKKPAKPEPELDPLTLLLDPNGHAKIKRILAEELGNIGSGEGALGQTLSNILVADRNQAALKVFQKEMAKGKKKIAIFYGAAHMPDFEKRLRLDFDLKRSNEQWLTAWDLR